MSLIEMNSIYKSYRNIGFETQVLNDITLHINEGDYVSIIGPSGAGKKYAHGHCWLPVSTNQRRVYSRWGRGWETG